jgi:phosphopantothenate-cysteine ligase
VVVGNVLDRRKFEVVMVTKESEDWIRLSDQEQAAGVEIEKKIIEHLTKMHNKFTLS